MAKLGNFIPLVDTLKGYGASTFKRDLIAGLTVTALFIPEGMAYAQIAGLSPKAAFYAAPAGLALYALFGSSRQVVVTTSAAVALLSASTVGALTAAGSPHYVALTAALALLAGAILVVAGLLRLGRIAQFFSTSVLTGFVFGLALIIALKQVPKLFGIEGGKGGFFPQLWHLISHLPETKPLTLLVGAACVAALVLLERISRRIPAALVVLVLAIVLSSLLGLQSHGVKVVGNIEAGLVPPHIPSVGLKDLVSLLPGAFGIALVAFAEAIGPARMLATRHGYQVSASQEMIGVGAANMGAGIMQGFPIGCSLSNSSANDEVGARTEVSTLLAAGFALLVALFFTPLFRALPEATLGAIVVVAVSRMMDFKEMRRLFQLRRTDFLVAAVALAAVLILDVLPGLFVSVGLSLFLVIYKASLPRLSERGRTPGTLDFGDIDSHPPPTSVPGLIVLRPNETLFFANATSLREEVLERVRRHDSPVKAVLLDLEVTTDLDVPAVDMLIGLQEDLHKQGIELMLARVLGTTREMLEHTGVLAKVGRERLYPQVLTGVVDYMLRTSPERFGTGGLLRDGVDRLADLLVRAEQSADPADRKRLEDIRRELGQVEATLDGRRPPSHH